MPPGANEAFSRVLIDKALEFSGWNLLDPKEVRFEMAIGDNLTSYWNERKAPETGVVPISSGYTLGFRRGREERGQAQFL